MCTAASCSTRKRFLLLACGWVHESASEPFCFADQHEGQFQGHVGCVAFREVLGSLVGGFAAVLLHGSLSPFADSGTDLRGGFILIIGATKQRAQLENKPCNTNSPLPER